MTTMVVDEEAAEEEQPGLALVRNTRNLRPASISRPFGAIPLYKLPRPLVSIPAADRSLRQRRATCTLAVAVAAVWAEIPGDTRSFARDIGLELPESLQPSSPAQSSFAA